jgi:hypothetical protein
MMKEPVVDYLYPGIRFDTPWHGEALCVYLHEPAYAHPGEWIGVCSQGRWIAYTDVPKDMPLEEREKIGQLLLDILHARGVG